MDSKSLTTEQKYPVWGITGTVIWGVVIAIAFVITQTLAMSVYIGFQHGDVAPAEYEALMSNLQYDGTFLSICTFATLVVCSTLIFGIVKLKKHSNIKHYLALQRLSLNDVKYWFLAIVAFIVVSDLITLAIGRPIVPEFMSSVYASAEPIWLLWLALIIAAPLFEELFFRGFMISGLYSSFVGPVGAIIISSALWASIHVQYDIYGLLTIFLMGLVLGTARHKTGSVLVTMGMHSLGNLIATVEAAI